MHSGVWSKPTVDKYLLIALTIGPPTRMWETSIRFIDDDSPKAERFRAMVRELFPMEYRSFGISSFAMDYTFWYQHEQQTSTQISQAVVRRTQHHD